MLVVSGRRSAVLQERGTCAAGLYLAGLPARWCVSDAACIEQSAEEPIWLQMMRQTSHLWPPLISRNLNPTIRTDHHGKMVSVCTSA